MLHKLFVLFSIILLTIFAIQCGQSSGPTAPGMVTAQAGDAMLEGSVTASGANPVDFNQVKIGVKGTDMETQPDQNGNFHLAGLPSGNITVEVSVQNTVSNLALDNVQSREEIKAQIEINDTNAAQWSHMDRNRKAEAELKLEIRPQKWNVDWVNSLDEDTVCFRIYGDGFKDIDPGSVVITCVETTEEVEWDDYEIGGVYFKIFITQKAAIDLFPGPKRGEDYNFEVNLKVGDDDPIVSPLTDKIFIVGPKPEDGKDGPLTVKISPKKWNTSWMKSNGQVTVQFRGDGFDEIADNSVLLRYTDLSGTKELHSFRDSLDGNHYTAKFSQKDALALIRDPQSGTSYKIMVVYYFEGNPVEMNKLFTIEIVGKKEKD